MLRSLKTYRQQEKKDSPWSASANGGSETVMINSDRSHGIVTRPVVFKSVKFTLWKGETRSVIKKYYI